ncbi:MAG: NHL repeat-containing protein [Candidatus Paceibacterota bacterium]
MGYVPGVANGGLPNNGDITKGFFYPTAISSNGTKLAIADYNNNRVLIYNTIPTSDNPMPDVVVGQPDLYLGYSENGTNASASATTLKTPTGVLLTNSKLIIVDSGNNRVLIYNTIPTSNGASADVVIGQADMITGTANTGSRSAATLNSPKSVYSDNGTRLFIADTSNHRVLIYNSIPVANGASANIVIGQASMTVGSSNRAIGPGANTLSSPYSVYSDGTKLFIADYANHRVLIYNTIPAIDGASANVVIGQTAMNLNSSGTTAKKLKNPQGVFSVGDKLLIADYNNNRVLVYNSIPIAADTSADVVIGQADFTSGSTNQGGSTASANTLYNPYGLYSDGVKFFVADYSNNRVLIYNTIPSSADTSADVVIGQVSMTALSKYQSNNILANNIGTSLHAYYHNSKLFISDCTDNRVLIYNSIPTSNGASADVVIGQADFTSGTANRGGAVAANTLSCPYHTFVYNDKLFIVDAGNNRVLIYNTIPTSNGVSADVVIGQPDMILVQLI